MSKSKAPSSYRKLFSNTLTFAIGSFSSKILVFLLIPIYTNALSQYEMGFTDLLTQIANWAIPIASMTIAEAVIRFGLDKAYDKKAVFTVGNIVCLAGLAIFAVIQSIVMLTGVADRYLGDYGVILYLYIFMSSMKTLYSTYVRAMEKVTLFAVNGIIATVFTLLFNILFFSVFPKDFRFFGIGGILSSPIAKYLLAIILADFISTVFLLFACKLWQHFDLRRWNRDLLRVMLQYSVPLIPAQLLWLITNSSDSFMTTHIMGEDANGVLSAAYKIPNIVATVYLMFGQAWNMSAITENDSDDRDKFYEKVFDFNQSLIYILAAGCLLIIQPLTYIMIGKKFHECLLYSPILIYSSVFSCFTTFMGSIYIATKRSGRSLVTSLISGVVNVALNIILIPRIGLYGPAISTVAAYFSVFVARTIDSKKLIPFRIDYTKMVVSNAALILMTVINVKTPDFLKSFDLSDIFIALSLLMLFTMVFVYNAKSLSSLLSRFLPKRIVEHFESASFIKDTLSFLIVILLLGCIGAGFHFRVLHLNEAAAILVALAAALIMLKKRWFGYFMIIVLSCYVYTKQGFFAAAVSFLIMTIPSMVMKKRLWDMIVSVLLISAVVGHYVHALFVVLIIAAFIPCFMLTYASEIRELIYKHVYKR